MNRTGTGAMARISDAMQPWVGRRYEFGQRGLVPVSAPALGQVYLTTADPAEGMQAVLITEVKKGERQIVAAHWLSGRRTGTKDQLYGATLWRPTPKGERQEALSFAPKGQMSLLGTGAVSRRGGVSVSWSDTPATRRSQALGPNDYQLIVERVSGGFSWIIQQQLLLAQGTSADLPGAKTAAEAALRALVKGGKQPTRAAEPANPSPRGRQGSPSRRRATTTHGAADVRSARRSTGGKGAAEASKAEGLQLTWWDAPDPVRSSSTHSWRHLFVTKQGDDWHWEIHYDGREVASGTAFSMLGAKKAATKELERILRRAATTPAAATGALRASRGAPKVSTAAEAHLKAALVAWRGALTAYTAALRKGRPSSDHLSAFWTHTIRLADALGLDVSDAYWYARNERIYADADAWWVEQAHTSGGSAIVDVLAAEARGAATKLSALGRKGEAGNAAVLAWVSVVLKLIQAAERLPGARIAHAPAPSAAPSKATRNKAKNTCSAPKGRRGEAARCHGEWDSIVSCVVRAGGLNDSAPEAGELIHAAGDRRHVPPRLLRKAGQPWWKLAATLTEQGFVRRDEHERPDEAAALQVLVDALRGGRQRALPELSPCEANKQERRAVSKERAFFKQMAEAMADLPPGEYQIDDMSDIPF